jgi:hypothetical protein
MEYVSSDVLDEESLSMEIISFQLTVREDTDENLLVQLAEEKFGCRLQLKKYSFVPPKPGQEYSFYQVSSLWEE